MRRMMLVGLMCALPLGGNVAMAKTRVPFAARGGLDLVTDAARTWAEDAQLIYVENDDAVASDGTAARWGYLFYSPNRARQRAYTVRDGKILEAVDLDFDFKAPPLAEQWIDSADALSRAEADVGAKYRKEHGGTLSSMLLIRGAFYDKNPDANTWTLVYTSKTEPSLFVVVDAHRGTVVRKWKG